MPACRSKKVRQQIPSLAMQSDDGGEASEDNGSWGVYKINKGERRPKPQSRSSRSFKAFKCLSPMAALKEVRQTWHQAESDYSRFGDYDSVQTSDGSDLRTYLQHGVNSQRKLGVDLLNQSVGLLAVEEGTEWEDEEADVTAPLDDTYSHTPPTTGSICGTDATPPASPTIHFRSDPQSDDSLTQPSPVAVVVGEDDSLAQPSPVAVAVGEDDSFAQPSPVAVAVGEDDSFAQPSPVAVVVEEDGDGDSHADDLAEEFDHEDDSVRIGILPVSVQRPPHLHLRYQPPSNAPDCPDDEDSSAATPVAYDALKSTSASMSSASSSIDSSTEAPPSLNPLRQYNLQNHRPDPPVSKNSRINDENRAAKLELVMQQCSDRTTEVSELTIDSSDFLARSRSRQARRAAARRAHAMSEASSSPGMASRRSNTAPATKQILPPSSVTTTPQRHQKEQPKMVELIGRYENFASSNTTPETLGSPAGSRTSVHNSPKSVMTDVNALPKPAHPGGSRVSDHGFFWRSKPNPNS